MICQKKLDRIVDFYQYVGYLQLHQNEFLICVAARDNIHNISREAANCLCKLGMLDLYQSGWRGYLFIKNDGDIYANRISDVDKSVSETIDINGIRIKIISKSFKDGNIGKIYINDIDCCVGGRGLNFVVFDKKRMKLIDSVCFDFWPGSDMPFRRIRYDLNVPFYPSSELKILEDDDTVSARKEKFIKRIKSKSTVIIGEKESIKGGLIKFDSILNIVSYYTVDEYLSKGNADVYGMESFFYILCTDNREKLRRVIGLLRKYGMVYGRDYMLQSQLEILMSKKKILTIVGFCQLDVISSIFRLIPSIMDNYALKFYHYNVAYSFDLPESIEWVKFSDILIYVPVPFLSNYVKYEKLVSLDAKIFVYPDTTFSGVNPGRKPMQIKTETKMKKIVQKWAPRPFQYVEPVLDELIAKGYSNAEILGMVMREDFFSEKEILDNFKIAIGVLKKNEAKSDLRISDYILENYQKVLLYRDCLHYTNNLYYEVARRIVDKLGICSKEDIDAIEKSNDRQFMDVSEHPIYPSVAKTLHIEYATPDYKYRVRAGNDTEMMLMTIQEWVENYCDYTRALNTFERLKIMDRFRSL